MRRSIAMLTLSLCLACYDSGPTVPPSPGIVTFLYVSHLSAACPGTPDSGFCFHHVGGEKGADVVTQWRGAVPMYDAGPDRWKTTIADVPLIAPLRITIADNHCCCFEECQVLRNSEVYANGVLLTHIVTERVGDYVDEYLEFRVTANGAIEP